MFLFCRDLAAVVDSGFRIRTTQTILNPEGQIIGRTCAVCDKTFHGSGTQKAMADHHANAHGGNQAGFIYILSTCTHILPKGIKWGKN